MAGEGEQMLRTYIDLADDFPLSLLTGAERHFVTPADGEVEYLGTGLSGDIHGKIGEVARLQIGPFTLEQVRTVFVPAKTRSKQDFADAILGNGLLERFHVVFEYGRARLLLRPNARFGESFK